MSDLLVPAVRTVISIDEYARAVLRSWHVIDDSVPCREAVAVLWAQYMMETGGKACWGWNVGNVKAIPGMPYHELRGVWEGVTPAEAERLISSGQATRDTSAAHQRQVGPHRVSVVFEPPHPATRFVAFASLAQAMEHHLRFLARRYAPAWGSLLAGDVDGFARALRAHGYFTASPEAYAGGMRPAFAAFARSSAYDTARGELADETPTLPELPLTRDGSGL